MKKSALKKNELESLLQDAISVLARYEPLKQYALAIHAQYPESKYGEIHRISTCDAVSRMIDIVPNISAPIRTMVSGYADPDFRADAIDLTPEILEGVGKKQALWKPIYEKMKYAITQYPLEPAASLNQEQALAALDRLNFAIDHLARNAHHHMRPVASPTPKPSGVTVESSELLQSQVRRKSSEK